MDKWQNVDGKGGNMLDEFYSNPQRFAYTFQNYVFVTRVMQVRVMPASTHSSFSRTQPLSYDGHASSYA